jgi:hypothetical protein
MLALLTNNVPLKQRNNKESDNRNIYTSDIFYRETDTGYTKKHSFHNLRSPFESPCYFVAPIVFSFRAHAFSTWGPYAAFHGMALLFHINFDVHYYRCKKTSADVSMFKISPFSCLDVEFCLSLC